MPDGRHAKGVLHGEAGDAGGAEVTVCGEDGEVGGDAGAGRGIEAGDGEEGLHGAVRVETAKSAAFEKIAGLTVAEGFRLRIAGLRAIFGT